MSAIAQPILHAGPRDRRCAPVTSSTIAASSINAALAIIGDRWALRIVSDSFAGVRRFEEFQMRLGAARSTLASRLGCLADCGVLERVRYSDAPPRSEYRLTPQGTDLYGVTLLCWAWERAWMPGCVGAASDRVHKSCGHAMEPQLVCEDCGGQVTSHNTAYRIVVTRASRTAPKPNFRRLSSATAACSDDDGKPLVRLTDLIGDRWTLLVLCAGFLGLQRFDAIQSTLHIASNILTHRLNRLVATGLFRRCLYSQYPPRCEYRLTQKGLDLFPVAVALTQWGDRWLAPRCGGNLQLVHKDCGRRLHACVTCDHCDATVQPGDVVSGSLRYPKRRPAVSMRC